MLSRSPISAGALLPSQHRPALAHPSCCQPWWVSLLFVVRYYSIYILLLSVIWNYPANTAAVAMRAYCEIPGYMAVRIGKRGRDYCSASLLLWLSEVRPAGLRERQLGVIYNRWIAKYLFYRPWPSTNSLSGLFPFQNTPITVTTHRFYSTKCFISQLDGFQLLKRYQIVEIQKTLKVWPK